MNTLIIYASKYGCTADCANKLKARLHGDTTVLDVKSVTTSMDLGKFDTVVIGGSVYVGKMAKPLRAFCENNLDTFLQKKVGIFLCCGLPDEANTVLTANLPSTLLKHAKTTKVFGSEARLDKMNFVDKMMIKAVTKGDFSTFKVSGERIDAFAKEIAS